MADLLEQAATWLNGQRHEHMTRAVVYQRGDNQVELSATIGRTEFEQVDEYGVVHKVESRDYLICTTDLVLASLPTLPKAGDRIRETDGQQTFVYEVMAPGGEPPFRYSDPYRKALRIHTKHVDTES